jgi:phage protein D
MSALLDFVFGSKPLKKAAGTDKAVPKVTQPAGIDMAEEARKNAAAKLKAKQKSKPKASITGRLGTQFMEL